MAFNFTPERQVLNFGPRHHTRWGSRQFLLWPAWAYRVVAPRVRQRHLNVLQRAVMGLCRAGLMQSAALAEHLSVHTDLAAFIVMELSDLGYLDADGLPTGQGLRVLENDAIDTDELVAGYVFQDPWKNDLWPRFVERLDYCELDYNNSGFPVLLFGTTGQPRRFPAFTVLPRAGMTPATPLASAVVEAVARHRKEIRFSDAADVDDERIGDFVASGVQIDRVSFVEEDPQPVFLTTYLYVPESDTGAMDWYACDPFGLGQSVRLRRRVESVMREKPALFDIVNGLIQSTLHEGYEDQRKWLEALQLKAGLEVDRLLTINVRSDRSFAQILAMESARQEMQSLGQDCPKRKINEVLRAGMKVLEAVFSSMTEAHPLGDIWKRVYVLRVDRRTGRRHLEQHSDRDLLAALYEGASRAVGFLCPIPRSLLSVKPGQIRSAADYGENWRLRPLIVATVLLADRTLSHPLRRVAQEAPGILAVIDEIAILGGKAGHANDVQATIADAEEHVEKVYVAVSTLLGLKGPDDRRPTAADGGAYGER